MAYSVNDWGVAVGASNAAPALVLHAAMWKDGNAFDLGTLGQVPCQSTAHGINSLEQVVGTSQYASDGPWHAFLWEDGVMYDLNDLVLDVLPSWDRLSQANSINDAGQIVGWGFARSEDQVFHRAFLLTPIPEPSVAVLVVLGALAVLRRTRRG